MSFVTLPWDNRILLRESEKIVREEKGNEDEVPITITIRLSATSRLSSALTPDSNVVKSMTRGGCNGTFIGDMHVDPTGRICGKIELEDANKTKTVRQVFVEIQDVPAEEDDIPSANEEEAEDYYYDNDNVATKKKISNQESRRSRSSGKRKSKKGSKRRGRRPSLTFAPSDPDAAAEAYNHLRRGNLPPGWRAVNHQRGVSGGSRTKGSYTTYLAPNNMRFRSLVAVYRYLGYKPPSAEERRRPATEKRGRKRKKAKLCSGGREDIRRGGPGCSKCRFAVKGCSACRVPTPTPSEEEKEKPGELEIARCPAGHTLQSFDVHVKGMMCDKCDADIPAGSRTRGCRQCDWDVCTRCSFVKTTTTSEKDDVLSADAASTTSSDVTEEEEHGVTSLPKLWSLVEASYDGLWYIGQIVDVAGNTASVFFPEDESEVVFKFPRSAAEIRPFDDLLRCKSTFYTTTKNGGEAVEDIATLCGVDCDSLVRLNEPWHAALSSTAILPRKSKLLLPARRVASRRGRPRGRRPTSLSDIPWIATPPNGRKYGHPSRREKRVVRKKRAAEETAFAVPNKDEENEKDCFPCLYCSRTFTRKSSRTQHALSAHPKALAALNKQCKKVDNDSDVDDSSDEEVFDCPYCDRSCTRKSSLTLHIRSAHPVASRRGRRARC